MIPPELAGAVRSLLAQPRVLVGLDFDGVLAPIVEHRDQARPLPGNMTAVRRLSQLDGIDVALISGRALAGLCAVAGISAEDDLSLVGSHGAESALRHPLGSLASAEVMTAATAVLHGRVIDALRAIVAAAGPDSGLEVEVKPTTAVLHTRRAQPGLARSAEQQALTGPGSWPRVHAIPGKSVVELAVTEASKGAAVAALRERTGADGVLYAGDDRTDETVFEALGPADVGVKVGPGPTSAAYRLEGPADVRELLQLLVAERSQR